MSPWSKRLLVGAMLAWSALTLGAGWYALRGGNGPASAANGRASEAASRGTPAGDETAVSGLEARTSGDTATQPGARNAATVASGTPDTANTAHAASAPAQEPAPTPPRSLQPVPANAAPAGAGVRAQSLNPEGPRGAQARRSPKGVIVLDPGHGRGDPGAVHHVSAGVVDITEADSNLRNAELLRDNLVAMGYEVYLTRNGEGQGPGAPLPLQFITSDLYARVGLANAVDADLYLALHGNGASVPSLSGPETWYCGMHEEGAANEKLAGMVQQATMDALREYGYFPPDRGIKEDAAAHHSGDFCQFVVTRETPVPAALLEFLFLSNDADARVLVDDRSHVLLAQYVAAALDRFMQERAAQP